MTVNTHATVGFDFTLFRAGATAMPSLPAGSPAAGGTGFAATITERIAEFRSQMLDTLSASSFGGKTADPAGGLGALLASMHAGAAAAPTRAAGAGGLSPDGRNTALFDPESAYRMMSDINAAELIFKARHAELGAMQPWLAEMQQQGRSLGELGSSTSDAGIASALSEFADRYNAWVQRFDADMVPGGLLAGTQAAEISRYELEQGIEDRFHGAGHGVRGLADLGFDIDPVSGQASLDPARLDAMLAGNRAGAVATLQEFGARFAEAARLLVEEGNFIDNRLANLDRVIAYIDEHRTDLQAEFGLGEVARPSAATARAVAAYERMHGDAA